MIFVMSLFGLLLQLSTAHALQCGTPGSKAEQRNLRANNGIVMINGVTRYGLFTYSNPKAENGCTTQPENLAMFKYDRKTNLVALFHCVNGEVYFRDEDNINFPCE